MHAGFLKKVHAGFGYKSINALSLRDTVRQIETPPVVRMHKKNKRRKGADVWEKIFNCLR